MPLAFSMIERIKRPVVFADIVERVCCAVSEILSFFIFIMEIKVYFKSFREEIFQRWSALSHKRLLTTLCGRLSIYHSLRNPDLFRNHGKYLPRLKTNLFITYLSTINAILRWGFRYFSEQKTTGILDFQSYRINNIGL